MLVCVGIYHATRKYKIKESPKKCSIILKNRNNQDLICSMSSCRIFFFIEVELKTAVFRDFDFIFFKVKKMSKLHLNFKITHSELILVYTLIWALCCQHLVVRGKRTTSTRNISLQQLTCFMHKLHARLSVRGREPPDAMSLRYADTSLPELLGRPSLSYAVMSMRITSKCACIKQEVFLNLCFKFKQKIFYKLFNIVA